MKKKTKIIVLISAICVLLVGLIAAVFLKWQGADLLKKLGSSDTFNKGIYIKPDYKVDGILDEDIWAEAPTIQFGNTETTNDEVTFRYYYGKRGVTASFVVKDPKICYSNSAPDNQALFRLTDAVMLYLDVKNDGGILPAKDDIKVCISADGRMAIQRGSGNGWNWTTENADTQVVVDGELNEQGDVDNTWTAEFFLPYKIFGIDKEGIMGMMLEWDDSSKPSGVAARHIWYNGGNIATIQPDLFHPMNKDGLAFAAPENWVPSMGRFVLDDTNGMVAEDIRALAYYKGATFPGGGGTVEATMDLTKTENFFEITRYSGLLLGVENVGDTEAPGWETKNHYGVFINDNEENPQIVVATIRIKEGKVEYKQIAGGSILDILPDFLETKICTLKVAKNGGWIEIYLKDKEGKYQHMYDVYDPEAMNGEYIGVRTAVKGFTLRDVKVTADKPADVKPYSGPGFKCYSGLVEKISDTEFIARTAGLSTFGSLTNKYDAKVLRSINTSLTLPEKPNKPEDKIKGILLNYNPDDGSYLILDYRSGVDREGKRWKEDYRFYLRHKTADGWGEVEYVFGADANTKYDFRITPIINADGATEVLVEYKKATDSQWQMKYCTKSKWLLKGREYGILTMTGNQKFGAFSVTDSPYVLLDNSRYKTIGGMFLGLRDGGVQVLSPNSMILDRNIKLTNKNSYVINASYKIVPDKSATIKGIVFNYNEADGSYMVLDYRYIERLKGYYLSLRCYDGKSWEKTPAWTGIVNLKENAWYDFKINVINGKKTTTVFLEYKTGSDAYKCLSHVFETSMSGRMAGYYCPVANNMQFSEIVTGATNYIGAEDTRYQLKTGAFKEVEETLVVGMSSNFMLDKTVDVSNKATYTIKASYKIVPDKTATIKGIVFNYNESDGSYMVLDYRYIERLSSYYLSVRCYDGKGWDTIPAWTGIVQLEEGAWYDFEISVVSRTKSTDILLGYKKSTDTTYQSVAHRFDVGMKGRMAGYCSWSNDTNVIQFKKLIEKKSSETGTIWPDEWME